MSHHGREDERRYTDEEAERLVDKLASARNAVRNFVQRWDEGFSLRDAANELRDWAILHQVVEAPNVVAERRAKRQAEIDVQIAALRAERAKL